MWQDDIIEQYLIGALVYKWSELWLARVMFYKRFPGNSVL